METTERQNLLMAGPGDGFHVEELAGVVLHAAEHHHGDGVALLLDDLQDVLRPQGFLALETQTDGQSVSQSVGQSSFNVGGMMASSILRTSNEKGAWLNIDFCF